MNTGMQDAFNLAWKLALVSTAPPGRAARQLLAGAQRRRRPGAAQRRPADRGRGPAQSDAPGHPQHRRALRDRLSARAAQDGQPAHRAGYRLSRKPAHGARRRIGPGPKAGERWPERLPAETAKARFIAIGPEATVSELAAEFPLLVQAAPPSNDHAGTSELRLVRPDGYVGFAGAAADRAGAEAYLRALTAR